MAERLRPYITETSLLLNNMIDEGKDLLFEGAQATLLDIDPRHLSVRDVF